MMKSLINILNEIKSDIKIVKSWNIGFDRMISVLQYKEDNIEKYVIEYIISNKERHVSQPFTGEFAREMAMVEAEKLVKEKGVEIEKHPHFIRGNKEVNPNVKIISKGI